MSREPSLRLALLFGLLGAALTAPYALQLHAGIHDEGVVLSAALRIDRGQAPYRDFDMFYTPASMLVSAAWFKLAGFSVGSARLLMLACAAALTGLIFGLSDRLLKRPFAYLPPVMFAISGYCEWPILSYHWFAITGLCAAALNLVVWLQEGRQRSMLWCGLWVGWSGLCLQTEGAACLLAVALALAVTRPFDGKAALRFAAGVALIWLPFLTIEAVSGALGTFFQDTVARAFSGLYRYHGSPYNPRNALDLWAAIAAGWPASWGPAQLGWAAESLTMALLLSLKYLLLFPVMLAALLAAPRPRREWRWVLVLLVLWTVVKRERLDLLYANYLTPLWYPALTLLLERLWQRFPRLGRAALGALGLLFAAALVFSLRYCSQFVFPVVTPAGTLYSRDPGEARAWQQLMAAVRQLTPRGRLTFAWPYACALYPLTGTLNPTRLDFLTPGWHTREQAVEASRSLRDVDTIYYFPLGPQLYHDYPHLDPAWFAQETTAINEILTRGFQPAGQAGPAVVYRRIPQSR